MCRLSFGLSKKEKKTYKGNDFFFNNCLKVLTFLLQKNSWNEL
jgi:hypothetical protein